MRSRSRAGMVSQTSPFRTKRVLHGSPATAARMKSLVTRTELLAFWKKIEL
jgi:hypothetical protein